MYKMYKYLLRKVHYKSFFKSFFCIPCFLFLYISLCGCSEAETIQIPKTFSRGDIKTVINYANRKYIDPERIAQNLSFVKAAKSAFQSLPTPLLLFSKEYYSKRKIWQREEPLIPGKTISFKDPVPYLIFIPDYTRWHKIQEAETKAAKKKYKNLTNIERRKLFFEQRKKRKLLRKNRLAAWEKSGFSEKDFNRVLNWIESNWKKYREVPSVYKKKKKKRAEEKSKNFGLHSIYFFATNGFLRGMDPHTSLIPRASWKKMLSDSEDASFEGIGALLRGGGDADVVVETPLPGSPALGAGLRAGDIIRKVDGESIEDMPLGDVVKRIRGPRKTIVILHVERPIELRNLDVNIKRGVIKQLAVTADLLTNKDSSSKIMKGLNVGVIHIKSFLYARKKTSRLVVSAYRELLEKSKQKLDAIVLDLRRNPGGYLEEAVAVADLFLPKNKVVVTVKSKERKKALKTRSTPLIKGIPLLVLVNSGSASASEILASALLDHQTALILGERSFGKATVQSVEPSVSGTVIKITSARYYAPKDYTVQVYGVKPDIELSGEDDNSFPPRFREENMWDHLPVLNKHTKSVRRMRWLKKLKRMVGKNQLVEEYIKKHKTDALRPDYMLLRSIAYIHALKKNPSP